MRDFRTYCVGSGPYNCLRRIHQRATPHVHHDPAQLPPSYVYNDVPAFTIDNEATPTMETRRQAELLFKRIQQATTFKTYKVREKREHFARILHSIKRTMHHAGCLLNPRNRSHPDFSRIRLQVVDAAKEQGLLYEWRAAPGSPRMSRLFPTPELNEFAEMDPWTFDPPTERPLVFLRRSSDGNEIPINWEVMPDCHVAKETQWRLELINAVLAQHRIWHERYCPFERDFIGPRRLRPVYYAVFTDSWDQHGRIYTGRYGHQSLRKIERRTIRIDGEPTVELDYKGLHTRMLYHLVDRPAPKDPYRLWGPKTTPEHRLLAKTIINAAINAQSRNAAISACNQKTRLRTNGGQRKTGEGLERALTLRLALKTTGLTFKAVYDQAYRKHEPIRRFFNSGAGMWLMRIDATIALDVMYALAQQSIPALALHDSFIVSKRHRGELHRLMMHFYRVRFHRFPVIERH